MRAIRTFAFAATLCTLAACSSSPTLSAPSGRVNHDNGGLMGTGNNTGTPTGPSLSAGVAPGTMGTGNITSSNTTTATTCTDENGGLIGTGNNTGTGTCDNGGLMGSGN